MMSEIEIVNDDKITITKNNQLVECDILFSFECDELSRLYIGYTDGSKDETGAELIAVSYIDILGNQNILHQVESKEEWSMINDVMRDISKDMVVKR